MSTFLGFLAFIIAAITAYGLFKPSIFTRNGKTPPRWVIGLIGLILCSIVAPIDDSRPQQPATIGNNKQEMAEINEEKPKPTFPINTLLSKNIDEVRTVIGNPTDSQIDPTEEQKAMTPEWYNTFNKDGYDLTVSYNSRNRAITDFFIATKDTTGMTTDTTPLLTAMDATESNPKYSIKNVKALKDKTKYTGIIITPVKK